MIRNILLGAVSLSLFSSAAFAAAAGGDAAAGQTIFQARCAACHTVTPDGNPGFTGPNLHGVIGRKSGTGAGFPYSDAMKSAGITWDADKVKTYLASPPQMVPGGKMAFVGPTDPDDVNNVVAYLSSLK